MRNRAVIRTEFQVTSIGSRANAKTTPEMERNAADAAATNKAGRARSPRQSRVQPRPRSVRRVPPSPDGPMTVGSGTLRLEAERREEVLVGTEGEPGVTGHKDDDTAQHTS